MNSDDLPPEGRALVCASPPSSSSGRADRTDPLICGSARPSRRTSRTAFAAEPPDPGDPLLGFAPYVHKQPRRNSITPERQRAFIAALAASGIVTQAARSIGASLEALYRLRHQPGAEQFSAAWELAIDRGIARLEDCALERAIAGEERVMLRQGEVVARFTRYDTQLLMFLLRQRRGKRWNGEGAHFANLRPGHPVYDRLKREWQDEERKRREAEAPMIIESINRKLELMKRRLEAPDVDEEDEEGEEE